MEALRIVGLSGACSDKEVSAAKASLPVGKHVFAMAVHVQGVVSKSEPTQVTPTSGLMSKALLAELVRRLGVTGDAFKRHLVEIVSEAQAAGESVSDHLKARNPDVLQTLESVEREVLERLPKVERAGRVSIQAVVREAPENQVLSLLSTHPN